MGKELLTLKTEEAKIHASPASLDLETLPNRGTMSPSIALCEEGTNGRLHF